MPYEIYETEVFSVLYKNMEKKEQEWVDKIKFQLKENPSAGKPLRYEWFREKKFENKRLYYLIYSNMKRVLLVSFGSKKYQQSVINHILENKERYKKIIESV